MPSAVEGRMNVIKTEERPIHAWYDNSWEAVLVLPRGSDFAFPQYEKKSHLPIVMSKSSLTDYLYEF